MELITTINLLKTKVLEEKENLDSEELFEHHNIIVDSGQDMLRIDKFLMDKIPNTSRNKLQIAAKNGNILVNQKKRVPHLIYIKSIKYNPFSLSTQPQYLITVEAFFPLVMACKIH